MTKEQLLSAIKELLAGEVKGMMGSTELSSTINKAVQEQLKTLQGTLVGKLPEPLPPGPSDQLVTAALPYHKMSGNLLVTRQGSVLDLSRKRTPWVAVSKEVEAWAREFGHYANSKGKIIGKTLEEQTDTAGGFLVPEEFRATMLMYDAEPAVVWPRATIWPMASDKLGMPKLAQRPDGIASDNYDHFAGVVFTWTDEGGTKTETEPAFEFIELIAHELSGYTAVTNILIDDSAINIMNFLTNLFRAAWIWTTDKEFIRGNGANKPLGIVADPLVLTVARATASTVGAADLFGMVEKLPSVFDAGAVWLFNKTVEGTIRNLRASTSNELLFTQTYDRLAQGMIPTLLGYPVVRSDGKTYAMGTKGDVILGQFSNYYIGDRQAFTMDVSTHYLFRSNKTAIRVSGRLDGQPAISEAFCVLTDAA